MNTSTMPGPRGLTPVRRWWREPMMWLVLGGPLLVVVASFITLALAIAHPDPVLNTPTAKSKAEQPAVQGRNHAATPER